MAPKGNLPAAPVGCALPAVKGLLPLTTCKSARPIKQGRSLIAKLSVANCYKSNHLKRPQNWALVEKAKYLYDAGFSITVSPDSMELVPEHAAANDNVRYLKEKDVQEKVLPYMDFVFGNETEAWTFSKVHHGWETNDLKEIALKISQWPKASGTYEGFTIVTKGSDLDDTDGAGDAFVGRFSVSTGSGEKH